MFTRSIANKAQYVYGIDISMKMLRKAEEYVQREGLKNICMARASVEELPFLDEQFDGISSIGTLQLFPNIDDALNEMNRVTKKSGRLAAMTYIKRGFWKDKADQNYIEKQGIHFFEVDELEHTLKKNGSYNFKHQIYGSMILFAAIKS